MKKRKLLSLTAFLAAILMLNSAAAVMPVYAEEAVGATGYNAGRIHWHMEKQ
ncbi:hypothetical protein [Ruminococcus callidus]|uniref:hypothetical protein n=1 Tax=Ruminococcus callidus TaxID=40519 RepID=UPI0035228006